MLLIKFVAAIRVKMNLWGMMWVKPNNIEKLYHKIINSHNKTIKNYLKFLINSSTEFTSNKEKQVQLIDKTIKKMLLELKSTIDYSLYDQIIINMGENNNQ